MSRVGAFERLLRDDPALLRSLVDQAADAVCLHEIDGRILDVNQRMCETLGYSREELLSLNVMDMDVNATKAESERAAQTLLPSSPVRAERVLRRKDGSTFPIELSLSLIVHGSRSLLLGLARDITDRKRAEEAQVEAHRALEERVRERTRHLEMVNRRLEGEIAARERSEAALRESEGRFRALAERGHLIAWEAAPGSKSFTYVGPQAHDLLGYPVTDWYRQNFWTDHLHPEDRQRAVEYCHAQSAVAIDYEFEYRLVGTEGRVVWVHDIVHVTRGANDVPQTLSGFLIDITDRKRAEGAQRLLLRELDHRVKNTLSTVQAVADMTLRASESLEAFGDAFRGRLAALARMHATIWRRHGAPVGLRELAELSLAPFGNDGDRTVIEGDEVLIPIRAAGALCLVLHELVTNAVKHGALSAPAGRVRVAWRREGDRLVLTWRESGGPPVGTPSHSGFGSVLIGRSIPYELGGSTILDLRPTGAVCTITFPLPAASGVSDAVVSRSA